MEVKLNFPANIRSCDPKTHGKSAHLGPLTKQEGRNIFRIVRRVIGVGKRSLEELFLAN